MQTRSKNKFKILITCEHGGAKIPAPYKKYFANHKNLLKTHRAYDMGALAFAKALAKKTQSLLFYSITSRLLIDLNRSLGHKDSHSEFTRPLPKNLLQNMRDRHWIPYRHKVESSAEQFAKRGTVLHIASHSFTPRLHGQTRMADVAFLYDPRRLSEGAFAKSWARHLKALRPDLKIRRNYPYQGKADGVMKTLRGRLPAQRYIGLELEVNQKHLASENRYDSKLQKDLIRSFEMALAEK